MGKFVQCWQGLGTTHDVWQVLRPTVALSDSCIAVPEHSSHRAAYDIAATKHHRARAGYLDTSRVQETDDTSRSAWREQRLRRARREMTNVIRVETERTAEVVSKRCHDEVAVLAPTIAAWACHSNCAHSDRS